uniref:Uncharacterized protein n=1 Tax=Arundo donax TaxID=35708 RepID=A0A0A9AH29_ARUDO
MARRSDQAPWGARVAGTSPAIAVRGAGALRRLALLRFSPSGSSVLAARRCRRGLGVWTWR